MIVVFVGGSFVMFVRLSSLSESTTGVECSAPTLSALPLSPARASRGVLDSKVDLLSALPPSLPAGKTAFDLFLVAISRCLVSFSARPMTGVV